MFVDTKSSWLGELHHSVNGYETPEEFESKYYNIDTRIMKEENLYEDWGLES